MAGILNTKIKIQDAARTIIERAKHKKGCGAKRAGANRKQGLMRSIAHEIKKKERKENRIIKHSKCY